MGRYYKHLYSTKVAYKSNTFECIRNEMHYKVIAIALSKDKFAALGANLGYKKKSKGQQQGNITSFSKFKGADHIYNRILWDKSLNKNEFHIGYEDRFLGTLEIAFDEFSSKAEIPLERIKYIKRNGEVIWDKFLKFYNF